MPGRPVSPLSVVNAKSGAYGPWLQQRLKPCCNSHRIKQRVKKHGERCSRRRSPELSGTLKGSWRLEKPSRCGYVCPGTRACPSSAYCFIRQQKPSRDCGVLIRVAATVRQKSMILNSEAEIFVLSDFRAQTVPSVQNRTKTPPEPKTGPHEGKYKEYPALSNAKKREIEKKPC